MRGRDPRERRDELRRQRARAVLHIFPPPAHHTRILACAHPGRPRRVPSLVSTADTRETSRAHQSKEGTRSRSNAASAQVNNAASYNSVPSNVLNVAYEAGLAGAKVHRLKRVRAQLQRRNPDLDLSKFTPEKLFPNMSLADIDALDEATFQAKIDEWKSANGLVTGADDADARKKSNAQTVEKERAAREAFGGTIRFKLAPEYTTEISKPRKAEELRQHLSGYGYATGRNCAKKYRKGNKFGEPCQTCVKFIRDLYNGTACSPCQLGRPSDNIIMKAALDAQNDHDIDFGVKIDLEEFKTMSKKRKKSASKPQGAKKAKKAASAK